MTDDELADWFDKQLGEWIGERRIDLKELEPIIAAFHWNPVSCKGCAENVEKPEDL